MLLAGHETTGKALSWTFALLDAHPDAGDRLLAEYEACLGDPPPTFDDLPRLRWTRAVIHEALRLFPPIWLLTRTALVDDEVLGYSIPAGALVSVSPYLIHRHPDLWDRPDAFRPERFLGDEAEEAAQALRYIPFGHGPRHCIGKHFAMLEMPLVLATIHRRRILIRASGPPLEPEALVTLRPRGGLWMTVSARPAPARSDPP
jgi:cytochrome P450